MNKGKLLNAGNILEIFGVVYMYAQIESDKYQLISLKEGNRYSNDVFDGRTTINKLEEFYQENNKYIFNVTKIWEDFNDYIVYLFLKM
jgi:hypothetical protein